MSAIVSPPSFDASQLTADHHGSQVQLIGSPTHGTFLHSPGVGVAGVIQLSMPDWLKNRRQATFAVLRHGMQVTVVRVGARR